MYVFSEKKEKKMISILIKTNNVLINETIFSLQNEKKRKKREICWTLSKLLLTEYVFFCCSCDYKHL